MNKRKEKNNVIQTKLLDTWIMLKKNEIGSVNVLENLPVPVEDWAKTPESVQALVVSLLERLQKLEQEVVQLREKVNRNSKNSSPTRSTIPEHGGWPMNGC